MKLLLIYPPFCNPSTFPYSISYLKSFVKNNSSADVKCLDLNAKFHKLRFKHHYEELKSIKNNRDFKAYAELIDKFSKESKEVYSSNNKRVIAGARPELFDEMLGQIISEKPDIAAFSLVYNSQCFYAYPLIEELSRLGIRCICGGPSVNEKFNNISVCLKNEIELVEQIDAKERTGYNCSTAPDFSDYEDEDYLAMDIVVPLKSCSTCYYRQCAFCTHYKDSHYFEYSLEDMDKAIVRSKKKHFFFIDDMISKSRLIRIAEVMKEKGCKWWCQLRPTRELLGYFELLHSSGLRGLAWGVESGSQKMLDRMHKGTNVEDIERVLSESKRAGIRNTCFMMFGFPGETKEDFLKTISFLKKNSANIDLCSTSVFGLQKGSKTYDKPSKYGIYGITLDERTMLEPKIGYKASEGMSQEEAKRMRKRYIRTIKSIDKLPRIYNYFREQIILIED